MQRCFRVSAPTVHQMVVKLAELGLIQRTGFRVAPTLAHRPLAP
ncbi:MAG: hypothetical protein AVDCRST_MAG89-5369 [uncultured Gemmatimonadetes bacterium]|uniref:Uncharacterized protein n=1 Tax=uncultured Gemmatimonadota bacterium TaxID=203437 RepID=A0A6J4NAY4_9BACT|nr:MAG: hypothetical protein AVDCRST_MAG89-5369 [uncultured Gemmatimonadota bacterium]